MDPVKYHLPEGQIRRILVSLRSAVENADQLAQEHCARYVDAASRVLAIYVNDSVEATALIGELSRLLGDS